MSNQQLKSAVRVRLNFDTSIDTVVHRKCWYLVNLSLCSTIGDLTKQIKKRFCTGCRKSELVLQIEGFIILSEEGIEIIRDNDLISVSRLKKRSKSERLGSQETKTKKRKADENMTVGDKKRKVEHGETYLHPMEFKEKKKKKEPKEGPKKDESLKKDTMTTLQKITKNLKDKKELKKLKKLAKMSHTFKSDKQSFIAEGKTKVGVPVSNKKKGCITNATTDNEVCKSDHLDLMQHKDKRTKDKEIKTDLKLKKKSNNDPQKIDRKKNVVDYNKGDKNTFLMSKRQKNTNSSTKDRFSVTDMALPVTSSCSIATSSQLNDPMKLVLYNNKKVKDIALSSKSTSSHVYFCSDGEEDHDCFQENPVSALEDQNDMTSFGAVAIREGSSKQNSKIDFEKPKSFTMPAGIASSIDTKATKNGRKDSYCKTENISSPKLDVKKVALNDKYRNESIILTNNLLSSETSNGLLCEEVIPEVKNLENLNAETVPDTKTEIKRDYSSCPTLTRAPETGDRIVYKVIELSQSYTPEISDFKEGVVISYNTETDVVDLELSETSLTRCLGDGLISKKFELIDDNANDEEENEMASNLEDRKVTIAFKEMMSPKLVVK